MKKTLLGWLAAVVCSGLTMGCHRAPQTAAELQKVLPHQYRGEIKLQGEQQARKIVIEPHDFTVVDPHLLEFNRVRYQLPAGNEVGGAGDVAIRGTISTPGLVLKLEDVGSNGEIDAGDAFKKDTFDGKLSSDLQTLEARWQTGFGQSVTLKVEAVP